MDTSEYENRIRARDNDNQYLAKAEFLIGRGYVQNTDIPTLAKRLETIEESKKHK